MWTDGIAGEDIEKNEVVTIDDDGMVWRYRTLRKGEKMTTKTCKKSGRKHTPIELAYLAGFLDGEGYFGMYWKKYPNPNMEGKRYLCKVLSFSSTNRATIEYILSRLVYEMNSDKKISIRKAHDNVRESYFVRYSANKALFIIRKIFPYLITKAQAAELILNCPKMKSSRDGKSRLRQIVYAKKCRLETRRGKGKDCLDKRYMEEK